MPFKSPAARKAFFEGLKNKQGFQTPQIKPAMNMMTGAAMQTMPQVPKLPSNGAFKPKFPNLKKKLGGIY